MLDLDEIIAQADATPRETADIEVIFNSGISKELETLKLQQQVLLDELETIDADLAAELDLIDRDRRGADARPAAAKRNAAKAKTAVDEQLEALAPKLAAVEERAAEFLVTFRITALHGFEWEDITSRSAPREGHAEDAARNYNVDEVTQTVVARSTVRVGADGELINVSKTQWDGIWKTLPSLGRRQFKTSVWILNEYATRAAQNEAVDAARKVSRARAAETSASPSDSGSTRAA